MADAADEALGLESSVVIKRSQPLLPKLSKLERHSNLNLPPPNWLRDHPASPLPPPPSLHPPSPPHPSPGAPPSSMALASHCSEAVGQVDVISDSKNIKKLLKMPFCSSRVSMAVHRVGKTLLIDQYDAPLLHTGKASEEQFRVDELPKIFAYKKDPSGTQHRKMFSKLLYHSCSSDQPTTALPSPPHTLTPPPLTAIRDGSPPTSHHYPALEHCSPPHLLTPPPLTAIGDESPSNMALLPLTEAAPPILPPSQLPSSREREDDDTCTTPDTDAQLCQTGRLPRQTSGLPRQTSGLPRQTAGLPRQTSGLRSLPPQLEGGTGTKTEDNEVFPCTPREPSAQPFPLIVQWSIKDIRMLLGSDLPIFGHEGHPTISLKLRDMDRPITVLTGLDYWLDNLMCNVPELAMCFHINGIVQSYQTFKTEEIPDLESCQFSPQEVLEVAENILAFLNAKCTHEGHTYWLFRHKGDDVVKLYDLTSLNSDPSSLNSDPSEAGGKSHNHFARSVALLFYRVARNMLTSGPPSLAPSELATAKLLLENSIKLLKDDHSQVWMSAYYLLADLFLTQVPQACSAREDGEGGEGGEGRPPQDMARDEPSRTSGAISALHSTIPISELQRGALKFPPAEAPPPLPPLLLLTGGAQERARTALEHISKALSALQAGEGLAASAQTTFQMAGVWHFLSQAGAAYLMLADAAMATSKLGRALRYARLSVVCTNASRCLTPPTSGKEGARVLSEAWCVCGDVHCLSTKLPSTPSTTLTHSLSSHMEEFELKKPEDESIITMATSIRSPSENEEACLKLHSDIETSLLKSIDCYKNALGEQGAISGWKEEAVSGRQAPTAGQHGSLSGRQAPAAGQHGLLSGRQAPAAGQHGLLSGRQAPTTGQHGLLSGRQAPAAGQAGLEQWRRAVEHCGNAWNELGVYYLHIAAAMDYEKDAKQVEKLWTSSHSSLMEGLDNFQLVDNRPNQALIYANLGRLMFSCAKAHYHGNASSPIGAEGTDRPTGEVFTKERETLRQEFSLKERLYYNKAAEFYIMGKQVLKRRSAHPAIWSNIAMDVSDVYLTTGRLMQDRPPSSTLEPHEIEREIIEVLMKGLHHSEHEHSQTEHTSPRYIGLSKMVGDCHYQLATLHQKIAFTPSVSAQKQKHSRTLCEKHYNKALNSYLLEYHSGDILRVVLEKGLLYEQQAQGKQQLKWLQNALSVLLDSSDALERCSPAVARLDLLLALLLHRLQAVLKKLVAHCVKKKGDSASNAGVYKSMYKAALQSSVEGNSGSTLLDQVRSTVESIRQLQPT